MMMTTTMVVLAVVVASAVLVISNILSSGSSSSKWPVAYSEFSEQMACEQYVMASGLATVLVVVRNDFNNVL